MLAFRARIHRLVLCCLLLPVLVACDKTQAPATSTPVAGSPAPASASVDVAVVTVIAAEFEAMIAHMDRTYPLSAPAGYSNAFAWTGAEIDRQGSAPLKLVLALAGEAGTTSGTLAALQTVDAWRPNVLVLAGIAGGLPPAAKRGDVMISTAVWGYEYGAIGGEFEPRLDWLFQSDPGLVQLAINFSGRWQADIRVEKPDPEISPRHFAGVTASGNKVIETLDSDYVGAVFARYPGIDSVEMEGAGALAAARVLDEHPDAPTVVMFRGISDIPNPRSSTLGDKKDRERWKRYASDSVAAFTVAFLREALQKPSPSPAPAIDLLLLTYDDTVFSTLLTDTGARAIDETTAEARIPRPTGEAELKVTIRRLSVRGDVGEFEAILEQSRPAAVVLVDTAMGVGSTKSGDVVMARMVWPFEKSEESIAGRFADARRGCRALLASAQAVEGTWTGGTLSTYRLKSSTLASGTIPAWDDAETIAAITGLAPRTAMIDDESYPLAAALFQREHRMHFLSVQGAASVAGSADSDEETAARNAARATLALLKQRWPYPSVNSR